MVDRGLLFVVCFSLSAVSATQGLPVAPVDGVALLRDGVKVFDGAKILTERAIDLLLEGVVDPKSAGMILVDAISKLRYGREWIVEAPSDYNAAQQDEWCIWRAFLLNLPYTKDQFQRREILDEEKGLKAALIGAADTIGEVRRQKNAIINLIAELSYKSWMQFKGEKGTLTLDQVKQASRFDDMSEDNKKNFQFFGQEDVLSSDVPFKVACVNQDDRAQQIAMMFSNLFGFDYLGERRKWHIFLWIHVLLPLVETVSNRGYSEDAVKTVMDAAALVGSWQIKRKNGHVHWLKDGETSNLSVDDVRQMLTESPFVQKLQALLKVASKDAANEHFIRYDVQNIRVEQVIQKFLWMCGWKKSLNYLVEGSEDNAVSLAVFLISQRFSGVKDAPFLLDSAAWSANLVAGTDFPVYMPVVWEERGLDAGGAIDREILRYMNLGKVVSPNVLYYMQLEASIYELVSCMQALSKMRRGWQKLLVGRIGSSSLQKTESLAFMHAFHKYMLALKVSDSQKAAFKEAFIKHIEGLPQDMKGDILRQRSVRDLWSFSSKWSEYKDDPQFEEGRIKPTVVQQANRAVLEEWMRHLSFTIQLPALVKWTEEEQPIQGSDLVSVYQHKPSMIKSQVLA